MDKYINEDGEWCDHECTSDCRRDGCNCICGEYHGNDDVQALTADYHRSWQSAPTGNKI